jgi:hypothetical protein
MLGPQVDRSAELIGPGSGRLARQSVDHVDGEPGKGLRRRLGRAHGGRRIVVAPQEPQRRIVQRLQAQRQAVHAGPGEGGETGRFGVGGIGLQRHFEIRGRTPQGASRRDDRRRPVRIHQRRRAAAEEDRGQLAVAGQCPLRFQIGDDGAGERLRLVAPFSRSWAILEDVEVAIWADAGAVRPVNVEPQRTDARHKSAAFSLAKARARWLMPSFWAGSNSAKVWVIPSGMKIGS